MINETLVNFATNATVNLVTTTTAKTSWWQFIPMFVISGLMTIYFIIKLAGVALQDIKVKMALMYYKRKTGRNVVLIKHNGGGLFSFNMITTADYEKLAMILSKLKGKPFDFVIHSPGGDVFASMIISKLLQEYSGEITAVIPGYAMSGGTVLALSCDRIAMGGAATLGPVDPQVGFLWSSGSAQAWSKLKSFKGKKINDSSFVNEHVSKQCESEIRDAVTPLIFKHTHRKSAVNAFVKGDTLHAHPFYKEHLRRMGFVVMDLHPSHISFFFRLINAQTTSNIFWSGR